MAKEKNMKIDKWLKRVWLTIGMLILFIFVIIGIVLLVGYLSRPGPSTGVLVGPSAQPKGPDSLISQDIVPNIPQRIGRTDLFYIGINIRQLSSPSPELAMRSMKYSGESRSPQANLVNMVITKRDGSGAYLLLNRKAFIKWVDIPSIYDSLQRFNLYDIAFYDTDKDGRINEKD